MGVVDLTSFGGGALRRWCWVNCGGFVVLYVKGGGGYGEDGEGGIFWWWKMRVLWRLIVMLGCWAGRGSYELPRMMGVRLVWVMVSGIRSVDFVGVFCAFLGDGGGFCGMGACL